MQIITQNTTLHSIMRKSDPHACQKPTVQQKCKGVLICSHCTLKQLTTLARQCSNLSVGLAGCSQPGRLQLATSLACRLVRITTDNKGNPSRGIGNRSDALSMYLASTYKYLQLLSWIYKLAQLTY